MKMRYQRKSGAGICAVAAATLVVVGLLSTRSVYAQALAPQPFNLTTTINLALKSSNQLAVANTNIDRDAAAAGVAESGFLPQISTSDTYQHLDSPVKVAFSIPGQPSS